MNRLSSDEKTIYRFALRYALTRNSTALSFMVRQINKHILEFSLEELSKIDDELKETMAERLSDPTFVIDAGICSMLQCKIEKMLMHMERGN